MLKSLTKVASLFVSALLLSFNLSANEWTTGTQSILDLRDYTGTSQHNISDDGRSGLVDIGFDFDFYTTTYTGGYVSTNGCFSFTTAYCNDYTPDPLPDTNYTIYPFWTDLIRDNGSKILSKTFEVAGDNNDYFVVGWYNLREYNRSSDNTFEMLLYEADSAIEFRYGPLDIKNHDVLIGIQGSNTQYTQYLFHDECNTGTTNLSTCVNTNWNSTAYNTLLENKSLNYNNACSSDPLSSSECAGYAAAYLTQQCGLNSLHSTSCPLYWEAYDDLQCDLDPQYGPFCAGYTQEESVAYYVEDDFDYGYEEEDQYGYEEYEETYYDDDPYANMEFTDEEWYAIDIEEFGQEQVDEWYGTEVAFNEDGMVEWDSTEYESYDDIDIVMDEYDEQLRLEEETYYEEEYFEPFESFENDLPLFEDEYIDILADVYELDIYETSFNEPLMFEEFERQEIMQEEEEYFEEEAIEFLEFETVEELEEWFEEEMETIEEEQIEEEIFEEEIELVEEEIEEEVEETTEETEETRVAEEEKSGVSREMQLNVVASTIQTATNSVGGTTAGTSIHATGNTKASGGSVAGNTTATAVTSSITGGQSMSNSPSISAQVVSSVVQTQQVLNSFNADSSITNTVGTQNTAMDNTNSNSNVAVGETTTTTTATTDNTSVASDTSGENNTAVGNTSSDNNVAVGNTGSSQNIAVGSVQSEITVAVAEVSTTSEADNVADKIIANNIKQQQEQLEEKQQETGEYADSSTLIAFMGFVPGFSDYRQIEMPKASAWYEPEEIYTAASIPDNTQAFYNMYGDSLNGLNALKKLQPNL